MSLMVDVAPATKASVVSASIRGLSVGYGYFPSAVVGFCEVNSTGKAMWSPTHTESKPADSAACATSTMSWAVAVPS